MQVYLQNLPFKFQVFWKKEVDFTPQIYYISSMLNNMKANNMKKLLITASLVLATASPALANKQATATITNVTPNYETTKIQTPVTSCQTVDVPIYGNVGGGASAGDVLGGMIIGGLIGKGATGKDDGAAAGAVIGGMIAADNKQQQGIVGYKQQQQCSTVYESELVQTLKNYTITFEWEGVIGKAYTYNNYSVGDRIPVEITVRAK